ncbi:MAG: ATP-binding protein [Candidatus Sericytochromatia bacterium]
MNSKDLGVITQGALSSGLEMKLNPNNSVEDIRVGKFVVVEGKQNRFFSMITDVSLSTSNQKILLDPPRDDDFTSEILSGIGTFGNVKIQPMLMLERNKESSQEELRPVKTIPGHFSKVRESSDDDFKIVFGAEDTPDKKLFNIGQPLDMDTPVCLDLDRFIERSNGIFGKSGTGKSFLTRLILCGVIHKKAAVNLIFDMHNEYGWQARSENKGEVTVKGLRQLFGQDVVVFSTDIESTKRRGISDAEEMYIAYKQIEIADLSLLKNELNLSEASIESAIVLKEAFGQDWLKTFLGMASFEIDEFVEQGKGHSGALKALQRKLMKITDLKYVKTLTPTDCISRIIKYLEAGKHVIIEFGTQNNLLSYMLATNIITRKIHERYVEVAEAYNADPANKPQPRKLMITIEEAHKFLDPAIAKSTIFGTIAREMRKYFVTLLIVDQRPSGIDNEILSQIGTRITALLNDDKDIDAVFTGVSGGSTLKTVLSQLDPKQQALILGYAVPMPVVVRTRPYNMEFYKALGYMEFSQENKAKIIEIGKKAQNELFPI